MMALCPPLKIIMPWFLNCGIMDFSTATGRSNWILLRKWRYYTCCLRDVILKLERSLSNKQFVKYINFRSKIQLDHPV